ncbi:MAG: RNA degradosome polyphosphate kinase [Clostridiales bacterium]
MEDISIHSKYINRELNWLEFNDRVLSEVIDRDNPLFERMKFASIVSSNLDEFFMIRVASLYDQVNAGFAKRDISGLTPKEQIAKIDKKVHDMVERLYKCYLRNIIRSLNYEDIYFLKEKNLDQKQTEFIKKFYLKNIFPVITPMVVDISRPFPLILSKSLNIALLLENRKKGEGNIFATVQVPSVLKRYIQLPSDNMDFMLIEDVIKMFLEDLFNGHKIITSACYRITRNADNGLDEEEAEDLLEAIEQYIKKRKWGATIRLEVEKGIEEDLLNVLVKEFYVPKSGIYNINGPIDLTFLMKMYSIKGFEHIKYKPFIPQSPAYVLEKFNEDDSLIKEDVFEIINRGDGLVHHPYESFDIIIDMVNQAADNPDVLAIKQTLYRVSGNSPIIKALMRAAENGKQVTVLVELKARFDEENNILWAKQLEMSGCHVIYGLVGLKIHCKMLLVVKRENNEIKRYVHLGTGNYNDVTAKIYTDIGFLTCNPYIGSDVSAIFNMLSGYSRLVDLYKLTIAPINLRNKFLKLIEQEIKNVKNGKKGKIIAKVNSLFDKGISDALYRASSKGVKIELIIRGICCIKPNLKGISENIKIRSIVGRFLEHTRIFYFYNDGNEQIFLSSADWMTRNLDKRVETLFPIEDKKLMKQLKAILNIYLCDRQKSRIMTKDGEYKRIRRKKGQNLSSQEYFYSKSRETTKNFKTIDVDNFKIKLEAD